MTLLAIAVLLTAAPTDACPMTEAEVAAVTGQKVAKVETRAAVWNTLQCVYQLESGSVVLSRVAPEARNAKTEAELAARLEEAEKRRRLKDFPVPAYSCSGGAYVVTAKGTWQALVQHGDKPLDGLKVARALIDALGK